MAEITSGKKKKLASKPDNKKNVNKKQVVPEVMPASDSFPWEFIAIGALFVLLLIIQSWGLKYDIHVYFAAGAALIFIASFIKKSNRKLLFEKITPIIAIITAQCLLYFAGLFYGSYTKFALQQFFLNVGGLLIFAVTYVCFRRSEKNSGRFLVLFAAAVAFASLLSIELATSRFMLGFFEDFAKNLHTTLPPDFAVFETNTRIITLPGNPNVFAPLTVLGMYAALFGCDAAGCKSKGTAFKIFVALICGAAFILCFSMGTILAYFPSVLFIIIMARKEDRGRAIFANAYCLIFSLIQASVVFLLRDKSVLPLVSVILISAAGALLYIYIKPVEIPAFKIKNKAAIAAGAILVCAVFFAAAIMLKGPYNLSKGGGFRRAEALKPGDYKIELTLEKAAPGASVAVSIESMSYAEAALKEKTPLKTAELHAGDALDFHVPDSSAAVFFSFSAAKDVKITKASISGGTQKELSLRYKLLPEFIVNRMQGIWVNDNAIQRFIFFRDGIRLGLKSPVIGLGGGAFEGGLYSVADYKYETKHAHNEYIQDFVDGGLLGLLLFIMLTIFIFRALIKSRKSENMRLLFPFLFGSMLMVFLHCMLEVDFSFSPYRIAAFSFFALIAAECGDSFEESFKLKNAVMPVFSIISAAAVLLLAGRIHAVNITSQKVSLNNLKDAAVYDPFNNNDYKLSYVVNTMKNKTEAVSAQRGKYLDSFENKKLSADSEYLLAYYYLTKDEPDIEKGIKAAESFIRGKRVDTQSWNELFMIYEDAYYSVRDKQDKILKLSDSIKGLCGYLSELNRTLPKKIEPDLASNIYMQAVSISENLLTQKFMDSRIPCDFNQDGVTDILKSSDAKNGKWEMNVYLLQYAPYTIKVYMDSSSTMEVLINGQHKICNYDSERKCFVAHFFNENPEIQVLTITTDKFSDSSYFTIEMIND